MRDAFFRWLPILCFLPLAILVFSLPKSIPSSQRLFLSALILGLGVVVIAMIMISMTLPRQAPKLEPAMDFEASDHLEAILASFQRLGFQPQPPLKMHVRPAGILIPMAHPELPHTASVFCSGTLPPKIVYDIQSFVLDRENVLISLPDPAAALLPLPEGNLTQVIPEALPSELLKAHRKAHEFLVTNGVMFEPHPTEDIESIHRGLQRITEVSRSNVLRTAWIALWRSFSRSNPHKKPIEQQNDVQEAIALLKSSNRPRTS